MIFKITSICKGGGYKYCRTDPPHPKANSKGLYPLHRVLAENKIGRLLESGEDVHHVNENKEDNSSENLEVLSKSEHSRRHRKSTFLELKCFACKGIFVIKAHEYRLRIKRSRGKNLYCSISCTHKAIKERTS